MDTEKLADGHRRNRKRALFNINQEAEEETKPQFVPPISMPATPSQISNLAGGMANTLPPKASAVSARAAAPVSMGASMQVKKSGRVSNLNQYQTNEVSIQSNLDNSVQANSLKLDQKQFTMQLVA